VAGSQLRRSEIASLAFFSLAAEGFACSPSSAPSRPVPPAVAKAGNSPADAGAGASPNTSSAAAARPQQFLDPGIASSWTFPDAAKRKAQAQHLAAKLSAQLDSEHDRATTGAGFAFALVVDGEVVLLKAKGIADLENKRVATPDTIYRVASITKTFTATSVMALRDENKVGLEDPLAAHLAELDVAYPHRDSPPIRIRQVLTHSAGLARSGPYAELARPSTEADLIEAMKLPLTSDPGLGHRYSNFGFGVLGLMVGRKAGMPYRDFVRTRLLEPLGMTSSSFDLAKLPPDRLAVGYRHEGPGLAPFPMTANGAGEAAGGLYSSARDMAEWIRFQLAAWPPRDDPDEAPVKRATLREMHTPHLPFAIGSSVIAGGASRAHSRSVGLAWEVLKGCYFDRLVGHDGDLDGFHARLRFDADRNLGFVLLGNSDNGDMSGVLDRLLDTIATEDMLAPRKRDPAPALIERANDAVKRLGTSWKDDDHTQAFTETLRSGFGLAEAVALGGRIAKDVGTCTYARAESVTDALDAELLYQCSRGMLRASVRGTGTPLRLFGFKIDVMKPANDDQLAVAKELVLRMQTRDDAALAKALQTKAVATQSKLLLKAGIDAGACKVEGGDVSPWSRAATFRLSCAKTRATLRLQQRSSGAVDLLGIDTPTKCLR
jgi:CubicO group peptidase (beta-lactamase class C family)